MLVQQQQQQQERTKKADAGSRELLLLNVLVERRQPRIPLSPPLDFLLPEDFPADKERDVW